jgi:3-phenylpropionate/cinnamic acid dioxygenase small subunit
MAWAEMPASMSRRMVGNVTIDDDDGEVVSVSSTLFLAKARQTERVMLTAERRDRLAAADDGYRLLERFVVLDAVELPTENLSLLF